MNETNLKSYVNKKTGQVITKESLSKTFADDYRPTHDPREKPAALEVLANVTIAFVAKRTELIADLDESNQGLVRAKLNRLYGPISVVKEHCRLIGVRSNDMTRVMNEAGFGSSRFDGLPSRRKSSMS